MTIETSGGNEAMNTQQTAGIHLRQLINLLLRRWKLITVAVRVAAGLAGTIALVFPPRYTASAPTIVDPPKGSNGGADPSIAGVLDDAAVQTHSGASFARSSPARIRQHCRRKGTRPKETRGVLRGLLGPEEFSIDNFTKLITRSRMLARG